MKQTTMVDESDHDSVHTPSSTKALRNNRSNGKLRKRKGYSMMVDSSSLLSFDDKSFLHNPVETADTAVSPLSPTGTMRSLRTPRKTLTGLQLRNISPLFVETSKHTNRQTRHYSPPTAHNSALHLSTMAGTPGSALSSNNSLGLSNSTASTGTSPFLNIDDIVADTIKLLLIGDAGVGKTALILKYCNELQLRKKTPLLELTQDIDLTDDDDDDDDDDNLMEDQNSTLTSIDLQQGLSHKQKNNDPRLRNLSKNKQIKKLTRKQKCYSLNDYEELLNSSSYNPKSVINQRNKKKKSLTDSKQNALNNSWKLLHDGQSDGDGDGDGDDDDEDEVDMEEEEDDEWEISTEATIGIDIKTQLINLDNRYFKIVLWDTAGQERFRQSLNPLMYKKTQGLILVYDICSLDSLHSLMNYWIPEWISNNGGVLCRCYLIGNKLDLYKKREVTHEHVLKFVFENEKKYPNMLFIGGNFEASCKWTENNGVESSFSRIVQDLISHGCYETVMRPKTAEEYEQSESSIDEEKDTTDRSTSKKNHLKRSSVVDLTKNQKAIHNSEYSEYGCCS